MAERTARTHVSNILAKLGLTSRTQAALFAVEHRPRAGSVTDPDPRRPASVAGPPGAPSIVFVHGTRLTGAMWAAQQAELADEFRTIAIDLPGHGTRADEPFTLEARPTRWRPTIRDHATAGVRWSSACRSAATWRWRSPRASPSSSAGWSCRSDGRAGRRSDAAVPGPARRHGPVVDDAGSTPQRLVLPHDATRPRIAEPIVAGGFWSRAARRPCEPSPASDSCPRLAAYPGPDADHQRRARPAVPPGVREPFAAAASTTSAGSAWPARRTSPTSIGPRAFSEAVRRFARSLPDSTDDLPARAPPTGPRGDPAILARPAAPVIPRFDARSKGRLPGRRLGHPLPARHQGAAEGDAAAGRQADHPVRGRRGRRSRDRAGHHRHLQPEAGDRGPLRPVLRARAPARGEGRHRDAPPGPRDQRPGPGGLRPPEGAARPRPRRADGQGPDRPRAVRGDPPRRRGRRATGRASAS